MIFYVWGKHANIDLQSTITNKQSKIFNRWNTTMQVIHNVLF